MNISSQQPTSMDFNLSTLSSPPRRDRIPVITPTNSYDSQRQQRQLSSRRRDSTRDRKEANHRRKPAVVVTPARPSPRPTPLPTTVHHHHPIVYLIRHGQSTGQVSPKARRLKDPSLLDCGLTELGQRQAQSLTANLPPMDLTLCSPLTRALQTASLAFPSSNNKILVHYELRELGRNVPENIPRNWRHVLPELPCPEQRIDTTTLKPKYPWPQHHDRTPTVLRRRYVQQIFSWLAAHASGQQRPMNIAVVCHFHTIRAALTDHRGFCPPDLRPANAAPMPCILMPKGQLVPMVAE